jgi:hypothetical protein
LNAVSRLALIAVAVALPLALASGASAAQPSIYATYTAGCTFTWTGDNGAAVTSVPPGTYDIVISTPFAFGNGLASCLYVQFDLSGPGVDLTTDLGQGDAEIEQYTVTLQPSSTYTVQDDGRTAQTRRTFTTAASGTAFSGGSTSAGSGSSSTGKVTGTPSVDLAGSAVLPFRGALDGIVYKTGKLSLTRNGNAVKSLKTGRWTFSVDDESAAKGFSVQVLKGKVQTVTTKAYIGNHDVTLTLKPGRWFFFSPGGTRTTFFVVQ